MVKIDAISRGYKVIEYRDKIVWSRSVAYVRGFCRKQSRKQLVGTGHQSAIGSSSNMTSAEQSGNPVITTMIDKHSRASLATATHTTLMTQITKIAQSPLADPVCVTILQTRQGHTDWSGTHRYGLATFIYSQTWLSTSGAKKQTLEFGHQEHSQASSTLTISAS